MTVPASHKKREKVVVQSLWKGIPIIFLQHADATSCKRQENAVIKTDTAGCGWTAAALYMQHKLYLPFLPPEMEAQSSINCLSQSSINY